MQLIIIFKPPVSEDIVDFNEEGVLPTIGDTITSTKFPWDNSKADEWFSLASILDKINKDFSLFGSKTKRIKLQTYNNSRYESTKISLVYKFKQALYLNSTLKPLTTMIDDPKESTNQIEAFYVQCHGSVTPTNLKVINAALTQLSITLVKNGHGQVEYKNLLEFAKTQYQPNVFAKILGTLFSSFRKKGLNFSLSKDFNGTGKLFCFYV